MDMDKVNSGGTYPTYVESPLPKIEFEQATKIHLYDLISLFIAIYEGHSKHIRDGDPKIPVMHSVVRDFHVAVRGLVKVGDIFEGKC